MNITQRAVGSVTVLELSGRFDSTTAASVSLALQAASLVTPARIVANLASVTFIDSTALATLVRALKRCRQRGGDLHLCGLNRPIAMIFELTRLDQAFAVFEDELAAVRAFGERTRELGG